MKKIFVFIFIALITLTGIVLTIIGDKGNPIAFQYEKNTKAGGPYENSITNARYALTEAIVERRSFTLNDEEAKFASPDLVYYKNKFYSIFTPGISLLGVPFYIIGRSLNIPQIVTFLSVTLYTSACMIVIYFLARRLGVNNFAALLGGFVFLFGTNALVYAHSFTQHGFSTLMILLSVYLAFGKRTILKNALFGLIAGLAVLADIPNIVLLFPVGLYILSQDLIILRKNSKVFLEIRYFFIAILIGLLPMLGVFAWYNYQTTGSYVMLGQSIGKISYEEVYKPKPQVKLDTGVIKRDSSLPFFPRLQVNGLYTLLVSDERAWWFYSPVILFGLLGLYSMYKDKKFIGIANILTAVLFVNISIYSMFGDPWGGWAFGPRYLIPSAGILSLGVALAVQKYAKKLWFSIVFLIAMPYSIIISVIGAVTTSLIPPKVEAVHLVPYISYTYMRNIDLLSRNSVNSLIYNLFFTSKINGFAYVAIISSLLIVAGFVLYISARRSKDLIKN